MKKYKMNKKSIILFLSINLIHVGFAQELDFNKQIVGVEQKAAMMDQDINEVPDLFYGISPQNYLSRLKAMDINLISIPIGREGQNATVEFIKGLKKAGGNEFLSIIISNRKWNLNKEKNRKQWATDIAITFNAIKNAGLEDMVKGCRFDENDPQKGKPSNATQWEERFNNILDSIDRLNLKTDNAFTTRTILMHGEGYGANFKGVHEAHKRNDFENKMKRRCANYGFTFKLFDYGKLAKGNTSSMEEWEKHFINHCGLDELALIKKPVIFIGNAGDGLFPGSLDPEFKLPKERRWYMSPRALLKIFKDNEWKNFAFGPFFAPAGKKTKTALHYAKKGKIIPRKIQLKEWNIWKDTVTAK